MKNKELSIGDWVGYGQRRNALVMVGDMEISEAIEQLEDEMSDDAMIEATVKKCLENTTMI